MKIKKDEIIYLEKTKNVILEDIKSINEFSKNRMNEIENIKKEFYDNKYEYKELEISSKLTQINHDVDYINRRLKNIKELKKAHDSPYFGRIDFNKNKIYIGIKSIIKDEANYVYDWRAPISSMYYNYELGQAEYESNDGLIVGNISLKRQYKIEKGKLLRCIDTTSNIDDDFLQDLLSDSNEKMKNIVSTIQKDQNRIIRNYKDKYMIVQGFAGSGKTSVALHRIAYLLYKDTNIKSNNILILSPNDVFTDYISNVLPELGETNVKNTTFTKFVLNILPKIKNVEKLSEFIDRAYQNYDNDIVYKLSDKFIDDIDIFFNNYILNVIFKKNIKINNKVILSFEINNYFHKDFKTLSLQERFDSLVKFLCNKLGISVSKNKSKIKKLLLDDININFDYISLYEIFINKKIKKNNINYEDSLGLLYFYIKTNDCPIFDSYKHIIIDEAQDYTISQYKIFKRVFRNSSFTILGDINQGILPGYFYKNLDLINNVFNNSISLSLNKTYRCSKEIIEYSNKILSIKDSICMRNKIGIDVEFIKCINNNNLSFNNLVKRIAIITYNHERSLEVASLFKDISLIKNEDDDINENIIIIPAYLSKGLEFDRVIIYKGNDYKEKDKNLFYVACTRAQHHLVINEEPLFMK